jgi:hypothetical protein
MSNPLPLRLKPFFFGKPKVYARIIAISLPAFAQEQEEATGGLSFDVFQKRSTVPQGDFSNAARDQSGLQWGECDAKTLGGGDSTAGTPARSGATGSHVLPRS